MDGDVGKKLVVWPKVILFGDSLTQHCFDPDHGLWGALLANKLQRIADVIGRGLSGYSSKMCKVVLPSLFTSQEAANVKAFVIFVGANDACPDFKGFRTGVSVEDYKKNLLAMIDYLESIGISKDKVILMTPPPYDHEAFSEFCTKFNFQIPARSNEKTGEYAKTCVAVAQQSAIDVVDLYSEMMNDEDWQKYVRDGLHLSNQGSRKLYSLLYPFIEKRLDTETLLLPHWSEHVSRLEDH